MATTDTDKRRRASTILETILAFTSVGAGSPRSPEEAAACAASLGIPVALVWLAAAGLSVSQIDQLCAWWPPKGGE